MIRRHHRQLDDVGPRRGSLSTSFIGNQYAVLSVLHFNKNAYSKARIIRFLPFLIQSIQPESSPICIYLISYVICVFKIAYYVKKRRNPYNNLKSILYPLPQKTIIYANADYL